MRTHSSGFKLVNVPHCLVPLCIREINPKLRIVLDSDYIYIRSVIVPHCVVEKRSIEFYCLI